MDGRVWKLLVPFLVLSYNIVNASLKKGVCVGPKYYRCDDLALLDNLAWWYDWGRNVGILEGKSGCDLSPYADKYVPMIWGYNAAWFDENYYIQDNTDYLLAFNEPNHIHQANMTVERAVEVWHTVEHYADGRIIVSPAAAICGSDCVVKQPTDWFDQFFLALCNSTTPCKMAYLATHHYPAYNPAKPNSCSATKTMNYLQQLYDAYKLPIWLTEFACGNTTDANVQLEYMKGLLPELEKAEFVFRYAWFITRWNVSDTSWVSNSANLFEVESSTLNALGQYYHDFTYNSTMPPTTTSAPTTTGSVDPSASTIKPTSTTERSGARTCVLFCNTVALFSVLHLLILRFGL